MLADPRVRKLSFTGSTEVGRTLLNQANEHIVNCSMELGGNAPFVVFADADLDAVIEGAMIAKMRNGGEACTAANRFYVESGIADAFSARLAQAMGALTVGPGSDKSVNVGPLVNSATRTKVASLVAEAVAAGATLELGGHTPEGPRFLLPTHRTDRSLLRRRDPAHRDLRSGRADCDLHHRRGGGRTGQQHRVRPRLLRLHRRPRSGSAGQRAN